LGGDHLILGDIGTELNFTVKSNGSLVNLTGAAVQIIIKSSSNRVTKACIITDTNGGKAQYICAAGDFPKAGAYKLALFITFPDGAAFTSSTVTMNVATSI
jgi:hypothetical protein